MISIINNSFLLVSFVGYLWTPPLGMIIPQTKPITKNKELEKFKFTFKYNDKGDVNLVIWPESKKRMVINSCYFSNDLDRCDEASDYIQIKEIAEH